MFNFNKYDYFKELPNQLELIRLSRDLYISKSPKIKNKI